MRPLAFFSPLIILSILGSSLLLVYALTRFEAARTVVTIPEGATVGEINELLKQKGVLTEDLPESLEGYLFPDTYEFFVPSSPETVEARFAENFDRKVRVAVPPGIAEPDLREILIKASLVEKEVPDPSERRMVAGIMLKRLMANIPLQMDASLCYRRGPSCLPKTYKQVDSPFNTYLYRGLPPSPIANPGLDAVRAVLNPAPSPYWYYLSDPETQKTVFAKTLDEHNVNVVKYLSK